MEPVRTGTASRVVGGPAVPDGRDAEVARVVGGCPGPGGPATLVLVYGPPGVGKTAVVAAAVDHIPAARVGWADARGVDPAPGAVAASLVGTDPGGAAGRRARMDAWTATVLAEDPGAGAGPTVLVVDDAEQADALSLEWLACLLRRARRSRVLVILTRRTRAPSEAGSALAQLVTRQDARMVALDRLDESVGARLLRAGCAPGGDAPAPSGTDRALVAGLGHLTLTVPKVLRRIVDDPDVPDPADVEAWRRTVADRRSAEQHRFARDRTSAAPPHVRDVARAIAVLDGADPDLVAALAGVSAPRFTESVRRLRWAERVLAPDGTSLRFRTPAIRDGVLAQFPPADLVVWRRAAAKRLSDVGRPVAEIAAQLLATPPSSEPWMQQVIRMAAKVCSRTPGTGDPRPYLEWLRAAARAEELTDFGVESDVELVRAWVHVDAVRSVEQLRATLSEADARTRVAVTTELALALVADHRVAEGLALLRAERARWTPSGQVGDAELGVVAASAEEFLAALPVPDDPGPPPAAAPSPPASPTPPASPARSRERSAGATVAGRRALAMDAWIATVRASNTPGALAGLARRALVVEPGLPLTALLAGTVLEHCGAMSEAGAAFGLPADRVAGPGDEGVVAGPDDALVVGHRALLQLARGDVSAALVDTERAHAAADAGGWRPATVLTAAHVAGLLQAGRGSDAAAVLRDHDPTSAPGSDLWWERLLLARVTAACQRQRGRDDEAAATLTAAERLAGRAGLVNPVLVPLWYDLALLHVDHGRDDAARAVVEEAADRVTRWPVGRARALHDLVTGVLDGGAAGRERVEAAGADLAADGRVLEALEARVRLGGLLAADGFERDARGVLREAVELANRVGARRRAGHAHDALVAAGGRMATPTGDRRDALTATEREVARLAVDGYSNRAIAEALVVSLRTVELHLTHAYRKLAIRSRSELAEVLGAGAPTDPPRRPGAGG